MSALAAATLHEGAPAKVNLGLRIRGRRDDGYHLLESFFAPLACPGPLCDDVELALTHAAATPADEGGVELELRGEDATGLSTGEGNLAHRAATGFLSRAGERRGLRLRLTKAIPAGAGLGGGSSDAGAVLRALARLLPGRLPAAELGALALELGADVPFFLDPRPARVTGIGERVGPPEPLPALPILLAHPGESLATAEVYRALDERGGALTESAPLPSIRALRGGGGAIDREALPRFLRNDLEPAATALCPGIAELKSALGEAGAVGVGMTGSGPVVYGIFEEERERDEAHRRLDLPPPMRSWATVLAGSTP